MRMTALPSADWIIIFGSMAGSQLSWMRFEMVSICSNTLSRGMPTASLPSADTPNTMRPPPPLAKAMTVFIYAM